MRRLEAALLLVVFMTACAFNWEWQREGSTVSDLAADRAECKKESGNTTGVMNLYANRYVKYCLKERGWVQAKPNSAAPAAAAAAVVAPAPQPSSSAGMTFDECFSRCRDVTDRTKGECFDTCLSLR